MIERNIIMTPPNDAYVLAACSEWFNWLHSLAWLWHGMMDELEKKNLETRRKDLGSSSPGTLLEGIMAIKREQTGMFT